MVPTHCLHFSVEVIEIRRNYLSYLEKKKEPRDKLVKLII